MKRGSALASPDTASARAERPDAMPDRRSSAIGPGREANWLWIAPDVGRDCLLVIGDLTSSYERGLSTRFARIERIPVSSVQRLLACADSSGCERLPYDDGCVDCVVSNDLVSSWSESGREPYRDAGFLNALSELRRVLRPGGVLWLSGPNARWYRRWLPWASRSGRATDRAPRRPRVFEVNAMRRALTEVGFSETRAYFVESSIEDLVAVVPASRRAAVAYERERWPRATLPARTWWAARGLHELLYPDAFVLAVK